MLTRHILDQVTAYQKSIGVLWVLIGFIRYFNNGTKYAYSQYHADFNERVARHLMMTLIFMMACHVFVLKKYTRPVDIKNLVKLIRAIAFIWVFFNLIYFVFGDFRTTVAGIPSLQYKAMRYGFNRLTEHEQKNYYGIIQKQIRTNHTVFVTESYMNLLLHHLLILCILGFVVIVVGIVLMMTMLMAEFIHIIDSCLGRRRYQPLIWTHQLSSGLH